MPSLATTADTSPKSACVGLHACLLNVRSMKNKSVSIHEFIVDNRFDLLALTETWLRSDIDDSVIAECLPSGYSFINCPRSNESGYGGVGLFHLSSITVCKSKPVQLSSIECLEVSLLLPGGSQVKIAIAYRPPPSSRNQLTNSGFLADMDSLFDEIFVLSSVPGLLIGDFNVHLDNPNDSTTKCMNEILRAYSLYQLVTEPTHDSGHVIDLVITDSIKASGLQNVSPLLSDHRVIRFNIDCQSFESTTKHTLKRCFRSLSLPAFKEDLHALRDVDVGNNTDCNDLVNSLSSRVSSLLTKHVPVGVKRVRHCNQAPWLSQAIIDQRKLRRSLEMKWRTTGILFLHELYQLQRNHVNHAAKKKSSIETKFVAAKETTELSSQLSRDLLLFVQIQFYRRVSRTSHWREISLTFSKQKLNVFIVVFCQQTAALLQNSHPFLTNILSATPSY